MRCAQHIGEFRGYPFRKGVSLPQSAPILYSPPLHRFPGWVPPSTSRARSACLSITLGHPTPPCGWGGGDSHVEQPCVHRGAIITGSFRGQFRARGSGRHGPMGVLPHPPPGSYRLDRAGEGTGFPGDRPAISGVPLHLCMSFMGSQHEIPVCITAHQPERHWAVGFASADRRTPA